MEQKKLLAEICFFAGADQLSGALSRCSCGTLCWAAVVVQDSLPEKRYFCKPYKVVTSAFGFSNC
jgi:hypothetical protein